MYRNLNPGATDNPLLALEDYAIKVQSNLQQTMVVPSNHHFVLMLA